MKIEKTIKPIIRLPGSKYKLLPELIKEFKRCDWFVFYDVFGGSGIVSVNVQNLFPKNYIILNDYDNILNSKNLTTDFLINNQLTYSGYGKCITKSALKQFKTKMNNGYWENVGIFKYMLKKIHIISCDANNFSFEELKNQKRLYYLDPPYSNSSQKKQYKNTCDFQKIIDKIAKIKNDNLFVCISLNDDHNFNIPKNWNVKEIPFTYCNYSNNIIKKRKELIITNY